jgi:hypothetical protein
MCAHTDEEWPAASCRVILEMMNSISESDGLYGAAIERRDNRNIAPDEIANVRQIIWNKSRDRREADQVKRTYLKINCSLTSDDPVER